MKKLRVKTVMYDRTTGEYIQKWVMLPVSDEFVDIFKTVMMGTESKDFEVHGFGSGEFGDGKINIKSPLCSQRRFWMDTQLHIVNEEGEEISGFRGF